MTQQPSEPQRQAQSYVPQALAASDPVEPQALAHVQPRPSYTAGSAGYRQATQHGVAEAGQSDWLAAQQSVQQVHYESQLGGRSSRVLRTSAALARSRAWARPVGVGMRLLAYTIDVLLAVLTATVAGVLVGHWLVALIVLIEVAVIVLVIESRTGATPAQLMLRMRTTRDDSPFSLGFPRALARGLVQAAGSLVAGVGGWIVVASASSDPLKAKRSIADRAGRALVAKVPTAAEREAEAQRMAELAAYGPRVSITRAGAAPIALQHVPARQYAVRTPSMLHAGVPGPAAGSAVHSGVDAQVQNALVAQAPKLPTPVAPPQSAIQGAPWNEAPSAPNAPIAPRIAPDPVASVQPLRSLLRLTFDTGQSQTVTAEGVIYLGRKPELVVGDEQLVTVRDPDGTVSKTHLKIEVRADGIWVTDQGSTNGSELFDEVDEAIELLSGERARFEEGSRVRIGHRSFTIAVVEGA